MRISQLEAGYYLVMPASNAMSECSFSTLRRVKSYLRSTMRQDRLNSTELVSCPDHTSLERCGLGTRLLLNFQMMQMVSCDLASPTPSNTSHTTHTATELPDDAGGVTWSSDEVIPCTNLVQCHARHNVCRWWENDLEIFEKSTDTQEGMCHSANFTVLEGVNILLV